MRETPYRIKVSKELRQLGCLVVPLIGTAAGGSGWPDTHIISNKISFWIEFKGDNTKVKPIQTKVMRAIRKRGDIAYVLRAPGMLQEPCGTLNVCTIRDAFALLKTIRELHPNRIK